MIRWERFDSARVERAVQMLLRRLYPSAQGIEGSGGDDGQDIRWEDGPLGLTIFEVKSFTALLTKSQKTQIRKSLTTALDKQSGMKAWVMVIPKLATPGEHRWFTGDLAANAPEVELEWRGRDWLDEQFAAHEDLRRFLEGEDYDLLQRASEMKMETEVLANGLTDVLTRHETLQSRTDELSPFWRFRVSSAPDGSSMIAVSEKYVGASADDPINWDLRFNFDADDPEHQRVHRLLDEAIVFGGAVTIPAANVAGIDFNGSEETRRVLAGLVSTGELNEPGDLEIRGVEDTAGLPFTAQLVLLEPEPSAVEIRRVPVTFRQRFPGGAGITLAGSDGSDVLQVRLRIRREPQLGDGSSLQFDLRSCARKRPDEVLPVLDLLADLQQLPGTRLGLKIGPQLVGMTEPASGNFDGIPWLAEMRELASALDRLQRHCGRILFLPDSYTAADLKGWSDLARIATGERIVEDGPIPASIQDGHVRDFVEQLVETPSRMCIATNVQFKVGSEDVEFGPAVLQCDSVYLANRAELIERQDDPAPAQALFAAAEGAVWYWSLPPTD